MPPDDMTHTQISDRFTEKLEMWGANLTLQITELGKRSDSQHAALTAGHEALQDKVDDIDNKVGELVDRLSRIEGERAEEHRQEQLSALAPTAPKSSWSNPSILFAAASAAAAVLSWLMSSGGKFLEQAFHAFHVALDNTTK
jgi:hypothetical protein